MKIPKRVAKRHQAALALVRAGRPLTLDERHQVLEDFHEGAEHLHGLAGAFFTPLGLARDFAIEVPQCGRMLDLCAGIGALAFNARDRAREIVCVELNPAYVEIGRAVMPEATWICASVFDVAAYQHLGPFDVAIGNPPFGRVPGNDHVGAYTGGLFEYRAIEIAARLARYGVFIVPQESAPFEYSGRRGYVARASERESAFRTQTKIELGANCGIDTETYRSQWRGASPLCEIVTFDSMGDTQ